MNRTDLPEWLIEAIPYMKPALWHENQDERLKLLATNLSQWGYFSTDAFKTIHRRLYNVRQWVRAVWLNGGQHFSWELYIPGHRASQAPQYRLLDHMASDAAARHYADRRDALRTLTDEQRDDAMSLLMDCYMEAYRDGFSVALYEQKANNWQGPPPPAPKKERAPRKPKAEKKQAVPDAFVNAFKEEPAD